MIEPKNARLPVLLCAGAMLLPGEAQAFGVVLQYQGEPGDREVYFADLRAVPNRTPADQVMGPHEVRELQVTAVYEDERKPEYAHMLLQFRCPGSHTFDRSTFKLTANEQKVRADGEVTFRIGPGSYKLRRSDLKGEPLPVSEWKSSSAAMLSRAGAIACNHMEIDRAWRQSVKGKSFDFDGFGKRLAPLGLPADMSMVAPTSAPEFLDFAWNEFWFDRVLAGRRPDPTGKWARKPAEAEKAAAIRKLKEMHAAAAPQMEAARRSLLDGISRSQSGMEADDKEAARAAKREDGRKRPKLEAQLYAYWHGEPEEDVVRVMGNPQFNQVGRIRFLRYTRFWEKAGVTVYGAQGVVGGDAGGYAECFVEFKTTQGDDGAWRVDDVLVQSTYDGIGSSHHTGLCKDLAREAAR